MQEYKSHLSESLGWGHEFDSFLDDGERELTSLVLYFPQAGATGDIVQYSRMLYYRGLDIHWSTESKGRDEEQQVPSASSNGYSLY